MLGELLISSQKGLDGIDSLRNAIGPGDHTRRIFICDGEKDADIIIAEVISREQFECLVELMIG